MRAINIIMLFAIVGITSSCATLKVKSNRDKKVDITESKTFSFYGWKEINDFVDIDKKAFEKAFVSELKSRGLTHKEVGGDIVISFFLVVDKSTTTNRYMSYYGHGPYGFHQPTWGWGLGWSQGAMAATYSGQPYKENAYFKGTLVCDVFDSKSKNLAWQSVASKAFNPKSKKKADIGKIVNRIMKSFPIQQQKN